MADNTIDVPTSDLEAISSRDPATNREADAIRALITVIRSDITTVAQVLAAMIKRGFTAEETQAAVNEVAKGMGQ